MPVYLKGVPVLSPMTGPVGVVSKMLVLDVMPGRTQTHVNQLVMQRKSTRQTALKPRIRSESVILLVMFPVILLVILLVMTRHRESVMTAM